MRVFPPFLLVLCLVAVSTDVAAASRTKITIYAETARDYRRPTLPDGSPRKISFALAFKPAYAVSSDTHIRSETFARNLSEALLANLESAGFILAPDAASAEQLLVVRTGTTVVSPQARFSTGRWTGDMSMFVDYDVLTSPATAILGYQAGVDHAHLLRGTVTGQTLLQELDEELSEPRHYIVIFAYAFDKSAARPASKLLWRAHINVAADGPPFADRLDTMLATGSRFFGENSGRLIREFRTEVQIGEATVVEDDPQSEGTAP